MWTLLTLLACKNPAPPDELRALRNYVTARCRLISSDACRSHGDACYPSIDQDKDTCITTELFRWSACPGIETDVDLTFIADCVAFMRHFDCDAPCFGDSYAFDNGPCADVIAALETGCL